MKDKVKFQVGDRVEIKKGVTSYSVTTPGSWGFIEETHDGGAVVNFRFFASGRKLLSSVWINKKHLKHKPYTKLEKALL